MSLSEGQYRLSPVTLTDGSLGLLQLDSTGNLKVAVSGTSSGTAGDIAHDAVDSGNPVKIGGVANNAVYAGVSNGDRINAMFSVGGQMSITAGNAAGVANGITANITIPFSLNSTPAPMAVLPHAHNGTTLDPFKGDTNGLYVVPKPVTSGGLSISRLIAATSGVVKASAGQLYGGTLTNSNAAIRYLQIYNKATAGTLSTDTPALTIPLPPNATVMVDFGVLGGAFATGISWQFTTDDIAIPTTAGASTDIHGFLTYK